MPDATSEQRLPAGAWDTHCHIFPPGFTAAPGCPAVPDGAVDLAAYRAMAGRLGVGRTVVVQPNAFGTDNRALVETLGAMGPGARGVASVAPGTPFSDLERLHRAGVRGARIMDLGGNRVPLAMLTDVVAMVAPLRWVPVVQFDGTDLAEHIDTLDRIGTPWVLDHYGKVLGGVTDAHIDGFKRLMDGPCTVKLAAHYEASKTGAPRYEDVALLAKALIAHRPDRVIWGSNWPHLLNAPDDKPDDGALLETVLGWVPEADREAVFVENAKALFD